MARNQSERPRYFDGEYLNAGDFGAEQDYHIEMRRRLHRALLLPGIVEGLDLFQDTQGGVTQVSLLPGIAIDAYGREIFVFAPYVLGDADMAANQIPPSKDTYDVWLRYQRTAAAPPAAGYGPCTGHRRPPP